VLLLVTIALVLASSVLLIVGFVQDTLTLIYLAIACAAAAAVALVIFSRLTRRRALRLATSGVAAVAPVGSSPSAAPGDEVAAAAAAASNRGGDEDGAHPAGADLSSPPPVAAAARPEPVDPAPGGGEVEGRSGCGVQCDDEGDEVVFPIADYDDLQVNEIVPLLGQLDDGELREVRDRETAGKGRITVLKRIDDLLSAGTAGSSGARDGAAGVEPDSGAPIEGSGDATPVEGV
jgi:hypothetical protein